jgi:excisionase family DNA binding protein
VFWKKPKVKWREKSIDETFKELPEFLTFRQVMELLQISERTLWRIIACGELPATHCDKKVKIPKLALLEYLQERNFLNWEDYTRIKRETRKELRLKMGVPTKDTLDRFCQTLPLWKAVVLKVNS